MHIRSILFVLTLWSVACGDGACAVAADEQTDVPETVRRKRERARQVRSLLESRCVECHGPDEPEGGLTLSTAAGLFRDNKSGRPAIVPGRADKSELVRRVSLAEGKLRMPPEGKRLTADEIALLRNWIGAGAAWEARRPTRHWAYLPPRRRPLPEVSDATWPRNAIDSFVLSRLDAAGLQPATGAERARLIRRVSLDLIGLPPHPADVEAFIADRDPAAYERLVERLLSSPRYGERWARPWLDMARYADSNGYQADQLRSSWAYRDWVVRAFNRDLPYDQFTIAQLAGDLLPEATLEQQVATGFHRCPTCNVEAGVDPEENRVNQIIDRVNTTASVWLGSTLECAQCHNHKYDPFSMRDYYQLFAFFNNTPLEVAQQGSSVTFNFEGPQLDLPLDGERLLRKSRLTAERESITRAIADRLQGLAAQREAAESRLVAALRDPPEWHTLPIASFASAGGATHEFLDDDSVLVGGPKPDRDTYTLRVDTELRGISAFRIETLTHPSLPGKGPGRHTRERPNFVLQDFRVELLPGAGKSAESPPVIALHGATADFAQKGFDPAGAIDDRQETGWAINPQFHKDHRATFLVTDALPSSGTLRLRFQLRQHHGQGRTIGRLRLQALTGDSAVAAVSQEVRAALLVASEKRDEKQRARIDGYFESGDAELAKMRKRRAAVLRALESVKPETTLVMVEMEQGRASHVLKRGNFLTPGATVHPGFPEVFSQTSDASLPPSKSRLDLARWLVSGRHPLVARVAVNRWWLEFFGRGLVATPDDFGTQGDPPTHPALIDWLAVELVESGWSMKRIHALIVLSATYRQSSHVQAALLSRDPYNELYARGPRLRLSAEAIRDNALAISGLLSSKLYGPPVYPPQPEQIWRHIGRNAPKYTTSTGDDRFRRGVYVIWRRSAPYPSFVNFDAPDRAACVISRSRTNTPLQALTLLNDPAYVEMARALVRRLLLDRPQPDAAERLRYAFRLCVAREPNSHELRHLVTTFHNQRERFAADRQAADKVAGAQAAGDPAEWAALFQIASILLNLDETITRN